MIIKLSKAQLAICKDFSEKCAETSKYGFRGQSNKDKVTRDIFVGKCGEWGVYNLLTLMGIPCNEPDVAIYKPRQKSHSADLVTLSGLQIAVKTQQMKSAKLYDISFMLEKTAVKRHSDQLFITTLELEEGVILIHNILTYDEVCANLGEPKLAYLKSKAAIYVLDIFKQRILSHMPVLESGADSLILEA